ncbi:hypothetical protein [Verticiella sediminum]|uniref:hypothetical protein n=1 Tax=Verticiella sediminum TaxID=1247510 RepID=UPI001478B015|nr:hypothetical protein [Verticiella sediminum]
MKHLLIVFEHGPGISDTAAPRFGQEGHPMAIVNRGFAKAHSVIFGETAPTSRGAHHG